MYGPVKIDYSPLLTINSKDGYKRSQVHLYNGSMVDSVKRTSSTAQLNMKDPVINCIAQRVSEFQGFHTLDLIESFKITKYEKGQEFQEHFDWFPSNHSVSRGGINRITTFFAILEADCEGCGTSFPSISIDWKNEDRRWCDIVECEDTKHLTVKPNPGSALFWRNLLSDGQGDRRVNHAGLPLTAGRKVGLNIWTDVYLGEKQR